MKNFLIRIFATGLGAGYSPAAPGTAGTLVAVPLFVILSKWGTTGVLTGLVVISVLGVPLASRMEELTATKDPGRIVIDEIAGYLLTMLGSPPDLFYIVAGFLLFRFFDILKPPPVRYLERTLFSGLGVMADDLMAGIYAWAALRLLEKFVM